VTFYCIFGELIEHIFASMRQKTMKQINVYEKIILCLLLIVSIQHVTAQTIKGTVLDANHQALPYVTVRLLQTDSTFVQGAYTDSLGIYSMDMKREGNYLLS
jgi:hypothetical protein